MPQQSPDGESECWQPPATLTIHTGEPVPPEMEFFVAPPPEIGELISVYSTLTKGKQPLGATQRMLFVLVITLVTWFGTSTLLQAWNPRNPGIAEGAAVLATLTAFVASYGLSGFYHTCTFVGRDGMAQYNISSGREADPKLKLLRFADAAHLFTGQTRQYKNGIYYGTAYHYRWEDEQRKTLLVLRGTYLSEEGTPARKDPYYYPFAGELAWTRRLMEDVPDRFSRDGYLDFLLNRQDSVRISHDGIEVRVGSQTDRIEVDALKDIALKGGRFSFTAQDAKWYSNSGRIRFQYAKMANAKLFSVVLKSLWGVTTE